MKKMALRLVGLLAPLTLTATAFAQEGEGGEDAVAVAGKAIAAGLCIGITALEGIARNPNASGKILVPLILTLALIESLCIYALVISFTILG